MLLYSSIQDIIICGIKLEVDVIVDCFLQKRTFVFLGTADTFEITLLEFKFELTINKSVTRIDFYLYVH